MYECIWCGEFYALYIAPGNLRCKNCGKVLILKSIDK